MEFDLMALSGLWPESISSHSLLILQFTCFVGQAFMKASKNESHPPFTTKNPGYIYNCTDVGFAFNLSLRTGSLPKFLINQY